MRGLKDTSLREIQRHFDDMRRLIGTATTTTTTSTGTMTNDDYLTDAPSDGEQYAREDAAWTVVEAAAGGTVSCDIDCGTIVAGTTEIDCGSIA